MILTVTMNPAIDKIYLVSNYTLGEVHRPNQVIASPGGKGLNVARVSNILGQTVGATGLLGGGNGTFIAKAVQELGIKSEFVSIEGETRICINVSDDKQGHSTEVLEPGPTISAVESDAFIATFSEIIKDYEVIALSGSLPKGLDSSYYQTLIEICHQQNKKVLLDSSGEAFSLGLKAIPYLVKPNKDEIKQFYSEEVNCIEDAVAAIRFFKAQGIELPIISMGKDGCVAGIENQVFHFTLPPVSVINTVGSGDSFIAGCAVGIDRGYNLQDIIKLGCACGTANTQFAQTGFVTSELVETYFNQVQVTQIG
ncbi:MAG: 1-phosphofructokinase family hexose kinase [Cellulosilyticaceae bacterium]